MRLATATPVVSSERAIHDFGQSREDHKSVCKVSHHLHVWHYNREERGQARDDFSPVVAGLWDLGMESVFGLIWKMQRELKGKRLTPC